MPAMSTVDPAERFRAFDAGAEAFRRGKWVTACPILNDLSLQSRDRRLWQRLVDAWTDGWAAEHALQNHGPPPRHLLARYFSLMTQRNQLCSGR